MVRASRDELNVTSEDKNFIWVKFKYVIYIEQEENQPDEKVLLDQVDN